MMERKGKKNHHAVILGKGQGFLYFVLVNSFQGVILYFSFIASWIQCGCTIFGAPHCPALCVLSSPSREIFLKIIFRVYLLNRKRKLNQDKTTCYRVISSLNSFSFFLLSYKWQSIRLQMSSSFNPSAPLTSCCNCVNLRSLIRLFAVSIFGVRFDFVDLLCRLDLKNIPWLWRPSNGATLLNSLMAKFNRLNFLFVNMLTCNIFSFYCASDYVEGWGTSV